MSDPHTERCHAEIRIAGMHCASCEILLERKIKAIPGILEVDVDHRTGRARIVADASKLPSQKQIEKVIRGAGYAIAGDSATETSACPVDAAPTLDGACPVDAAPTLDDVEPSHRKWMEIGGALLIIFALYKLLKAFDIALVASTASTAATLGGTFVIGLVAGTSSCLAVTGGLLLSTAAKYNEVHRAQNAWEKFRPLLHFNIGRLASYFVLGGLVGLIGRSITLTPRMTGYMNIIVAFIMIYLALSILKIVPKGSFPIRPPKRLSHWIANLSENPHPAAPFTLGALTFFLPCGFTQSLQLAALASGSFTDGALTMFAFALGTLPALLGISAISSTAKGTFSHLFLRFSGTLVFVLALWNMNSGLLLTGIDAKGFLTNLAPGSSTAYAGNDPYVTEDPNGTQVINMRVTAYGYEPNSFTVKAGKPTIVRASAGSNIGGCTSVLTSPSLGLTKFLQPNQVNELGPFTPTGDFFLTCSMGMVRANVRVAGTPDNTAPLAAAVIPTSGSAIPPNAQVVDLTWTSYGYSPNVIEVRRGYKTAVRVSATAQTGGCMSTIVFPQFNQSAFVPQPGSPPVTLVLNTDQVEPGDYPIACGMGSRMATLRVL